MPVVTPDELITLVVDVERPRDPLEGDTSPAARSRGHPGVRRRPARSGISRRRRARPAPAVPRTTVARRRLRARERRARPVDRGRRRGPGRGRRRLGGDGRPRPITCQRSDLRGSLRRGRSERMLQWVPDPGRASPRWHRSCAPAVARASSTPTGRHRAVGRGGRSHAARRNLRHAGLVGLGPGHVTPTDGWVPMADLADDLLDAGQLEAHERDTVVATIEDAVRRGRSRCARRRRADPGSHVVQQHPEQQRRS